MRALRLNCSNLSSSLDWNCSNSLSLNSSSCDGRPQFGSQDGHNHGILSLHGTSLSENGPPSLPPVRGLALRFGGAGGVSLYPSLVTTPLPSCLGGSLRVGGMYCGT